VPEYLTPGVYFEFRDQVPVVRGLRTDIAAFVGLAESGPLHEPLRVESWRQFQAEFRQFVPYGYLAYAVKGFFENGGRTCYVVRVAGGEAVAASLPLKNKANQEVLETRARNEGRWGDRLLLTLTQVRAGDMTFSLKITQAGAEFELFQKLSLDPEADRYFQRVINEGTDSLPPSRWIRVTDKIPARQERTAVWLPDAEKSGLENGSRFLTGGQDGLASLQRTDFTGEFGAQPSEKKGLSALERVDAVAIVCMPDIHIQPVTTPPPPPPVPEPPRDPCCPRSLEPPAALPASQPPSEQPPAFSEQDVATMQQSMIEHCEQMKDRVAILDAPQRRGGRPLTISGVEAWRKGFESARGFGGLYYPWLKVVDPLHLQNNPVRAIPPCGHVAGVYARTDLTIGVHKAPANVVMSWAEDVTVNINDAEQGVLNPEGINCLRAFPGRGLRVYGARTVSSDPDWRYVNVRRLLLMIEEAVDEATQWAVFEPHDFNLRQMLVLSISSFLETLWRQGALVGTTPEEAFYVKCDDTTNPLASVDAGRIITEVGVAPTKPAEFVVFRIGRTREELELIEA